MCDESSDSSDSYDSLEQCDISLEIVSKILNDEDELKELLMLHKETLNVLSILEEKLEEVNEKISKKQSTLQILSPRSEILQKSLNLFQHSVK